MAAWIAEEVSAFWFEIISILVAGEKSKNTVNVFYMAF